MIIGPKDTLKLIGVSVMTLCAVFVCTLFLNYSIDIKLIKDLITESQIAFFDAQSASAKITSAISGGCLAVTSVIMLLFYIKQYIDTHHKELGILKALGYSRLKIAKSFWVFGLSVFFGTSAGFCSSYILMPTFYKVMNEEAILPEVPLNFNLILAVYLVVIPTLCFGLIAILYALLKLKQPALDLLRGKQDTTKKRLKKAKKEEAETAFLQDLRKSNVKSRPTLAFFIAFGAFCFSSMIQMTFVMKDISSVLMAVIIFIIGITLAFVTLLLSATTVVNANAKYISIMKVFGYSFKECSNAVLNGYRPLALIGFFIGTIYQYMLLKFMVSLFAEGMEGIPEFTFNVTGFFLTLVSFIIVYEIIMYAYYIRIKNISLKQIMLE